MADAANHWHDMFRAECLRRQDDAARYGEKILKLEEELACANEAVVLIAKIVEELRAGTDVAAEKEMK